MPSDLLAGTPRRYSLAGSPRPSPNPDLLKPLLDSGVIPTNGYRTRDKGKLSSKYIVRGRKRGKHTEGR